MLHKSVNVIRLFSSLLKNGSNKLECSQVRPGANTAIHLASFSNIKPGWKKPSGTNAPAYLANSRQKLLTVAPSVNVRIISIQEVYISQGILVHKTSTLTEQESCSGHKQVGQVGSGRQANKAGWLGQ